MLPIVGGGGIDSKRGVLKHQKSNKFNKAPVLMPPPHPSLPYTPRQMGDPPDPNPDPNTVATTASPSTCKTWNLYI